MTPPLQTYRILALSENEGLFLRLQKSYHAYLSGRIVVTTNILELLEDQTRNGARLVILDLELLENGLSSLLTVIRTINGNCGILLVLSPEDLPRCTSILSRGNISFVLKPVYEPEMIKLVALGLGISPLETRSVLST